MNTSYTTASKTTAVLVPALLALLLAVPAFAGVVYEIETTDHEQSPPAEPVSTEVYAEGKNIKMSIAAGKGEQEGDMIFRGDRREMVVVDHEKKSYVVMDEAFVEKLAGQVNSAMSQVEEALKNVPEAQRAMVEKMMKERLPQAAPQGPRHELRKTGDRATKSGYPCAKYEVWSGDRKVREMWVTDWSNLEGSEDAREAFEGMADFFSELLESIEQMAGAAGGGSPFGGLADNPMTFMNEIGGFPVVTRGFQEDGSLEDESELRSSKRRTLDPAEFEPPSGYKRRSMLGDF